jgi:hypothetical protein
MFAMQSTFSKSKQRKFKKTSQIDISIKTRDTTMGIIMLIIRKLKRSLSAQATPFLLTIGKIGTKSN